MMSEMIQAFIKILKGSGICLDSVCVLRYLRGAGKLHLASRLFRLRFSPSMLAKVACLELDRAEKGELFGHVISLINVAGSYKTTGTDRTPLADAAVLADSPARIMEVGVSDGTSALRLVEAAHSTGADVLLTDRFPVLYRSELMPGVSRFYDSEGRLMGMKLGFIWIVLFGQKVFDVTSMDAIETVNPTVGGNISCFNIFEDVLEVPVEAIKCSNVLNKAYFNDASIRRATFNLSRSLVENGKLVISQNNTMYKDGEAYFVLRKQGRDLVLGESYGNHLAESLFRS